MNWFCLLTQPKHEHIAAGHLQKDFGVEVYLPRIRFRRSTRHGPVWFTEPLFPGYLFARFEFAACSRRVHHAPGVRQIVHFGQHWPAVPDTAIQELKTCVSGQQVHTIDQTLQPGDSVLISGGAFHNLRAVVTRVMPSQQRVAVLLEFLGRQAPLELPGNSVLPEEAARAGLVG